MDEALMPEGLLGRVLAEAKSIQSMDDEGEAVWFDHSAIVEASGLDEAQVSEAIGHLCVRGDLTAAIAANKDARATLIYALTEALEGDDPPPEAA